MSTGHTAECPYPYVHDIETSIVLPSGHLVSRHIYRFVMDLQAEGIRVTLADIAAREARISPDGTPDAIAAERELYRQMTLILAEPYSATEH
jgi:hypothetical protein